jgi:hypothetical protein
MWFCSFSLCLTFYSRYVYDLSKQLVAMNMEVMLMAEGSEQSHIEKGCAEYVA